MYYIELTLVFRETKLHLGIVFKLKCTTMCFDVCNCIIVYKHAKINITSEKHYFKTGKIFSKMRIQDALERIYNK